MCPVDLSYRKADLRPIGPAAVAAVLENALLNCRDRHCINHGEQA